MPTFTEASSFPASLNMRSAQEIKMKIMNAKFAANTLKAYACSWRLYQRWCREADRTSMPASAQDCIDHAAWCISHGLRLDTVLLRLRAVNHYHRQEGLAAPCNETVHRFMRNAKRYLRERSQGKAALTPRQLRKISQALLRKQTPANVRSRAMLLLCFACGWRRSELVSLDLQDVQWDERGIVLWLGASKTDQEGEGRSVGIHYGRREFTCPVTALKQWLAVRGSEQGPLFTRITAWGCKEKHLEPEVVNRAVKHGLELIGEKPENYGAHSLRAGMITSSIESGATETAVMQRTGHRCYETLRRYVRPARVFRANPLRRVL